MIDYDKLGKFGDGERFYSEMYADIVLDAEEYLIGLKKPYCTLLATKLTDKLQLFAKSPLSKDIDTSTKKVTEKEFDALQYLSGYIIRKFLKKVQKLWGL